MRYDREATLISLALTQNEIGEWVSSEVKTPVLCREKSVGRNEFYAAAVAGHKPGVILALYRCEYQGQGVVEYEGVKYAVIRTYSDGVKEIELTCEKVIG